MNCEFCSTDAGPYSKRHKVNYLVDVDYLVEEVDKVSKIKGNGLIIFLDSVGEPTTHPNFVDLVSKLKKLPSVKEVIVITNGTLLTKERIDQLKEAGLDRVNISVHTLRPELGKKLFGMDNYSLESVLETIRYLRQRGIPVMITPVFMAGINDEDIEEIIRFAKINNCSIGLQNYEVYSHSRKIKGGKTQTYWKFYKRIDELEKRYDIKLKYHYEDLGIEKRERVPESFSLGEKVRVKVVCPGWMPGQMIGIANERCISINRCLRSIGDEMHVKILQNKNNIYLAE